MTFQPVSFTVKGETERLFHSTTKRGLLMRVEYSKRGSPRINQLIYKAMNKQNVDDQIRDFIEYAYSDDNERQRMFNVLQDYMDEVYEEPREVMVFTFDVRNGQDIFWKKAVMDMSPTAEYIPAEELHIWVAKYRGYGWEVKVN